MLMKTDDVYRATHEILQESPEPRHKKKPWRHVYTKVYIAPLMLFTTRDGTKKTHGLNPKLRL